MSGLCHFSSQPKVEPPKPIPAPELLGPPEESLEKGHQLVVVVFFFFSVVDFGRETLSKKRETVEGHFWGHLGFLSDARGMRPQLSLRGLS